jgi:hypothetical protein
MMVEEEEGLREFESSQQLPELRRKRKRVIAIAVLATIGAALFGVIVGILAPTVTQPPSSGTYWNGVYDTKTNVYLHTLRNWVDPSFTYYPHRTEFFDVDSDTVMVRADTVCIDLHRGMAYADVETKVEDEFSMPASPAAWFIKTTVGTYCNEFAAFINIPTATAS